MENNDPNRLDSAEALGRGSKEYNNLTSLHEECIRNHH
jgi:hypothetical protein